MKPSPCALTIRGDCRDWKIGEVGESGGLAEVRIGKIGVLVALGGGFPALAGLKGESAFGA